MRMAIFAIESFFFKKNSVVISTHVEQNTLGW